jgi:trehalose-6-phosphate synthase
VQNLEKESVKSRIAQLEQRFNGVKVIVGVDRLDYIKGVPQKLHALELFLTQHPEWIGKVSVGFFVNARLTYSHPLLGRVSSAGCAV